MTRRHEPNVAYEVRARDALYEDAQDRADYTYPFWLQSVLRELGRCGERAAIRAMAERLKVALLTYKAERLGMRVVLVNERYTTRTCPVCARRYKPKGRLYYCRWRGFTYHRDGVGAINIWQKYTNSGSVVGAMASPTGVRYSARLPCSSALCDRERIHVL